MKNGFVKMILTGALVALSWTTVGIAHAECAWASRSWTDDSGQAWVTSSCADGSGVCTAKITSDSCWGTCFDSICVGSLVGSDLDGFWCDGTGDACVPQM
jgi:hypothetical protein